MFQNSKLSTNSQLLKKARSRLIIKKYLKLSCTDGLLAAACCSSILFPIFSSWADSCLKFLAEVVIQYTSSSLVFDLLRLHGKRGVEWPCFWCQRKLLFSLLLWNKTSYFKNFCGFELRDKWYSCGLIFTKIGESWLFTV